MRGQIVPGKIYHVLNRGVDGRKIFEEDRDYLRFIHDLFEFNDQNPINNNSHHFRHQNQYNDIGSRYIASKKHQVRKFLVELLAFAVMPNHYHLLVKPLTEDALLKFIRRLNIGYANYFNQKNKRRGTLFEGRYKSIAVENDAHFIHLPYYIHCNPLDLHAPEWRRREMKNKKSAIEFLNKYRWSSHMDYYGIKNFPSVTQREHLLQFFGGEKGYKKTFEQWLNDFSGKNEIDVVDIALEPI